MVRSQIHQQGCQDTERASGNRNLHVRYLLRHCTRTWGLLATMALAALGLPAATTAQTPKPRVKLTAHTVTVTVPDTGTGGTDAAGTAIAVAQYDVYRKDGTAAFVRVGNTTKVTSSTGVSTLVYIDTLVVSGHSYTYEATTQNALGVESPLSGPSATVLIPSSATAPTAPGPPTWVLN